MAAKASKNQPSEACNSLGQLLLHARAKKGWTQRRAVAFFKTTPTTYKSWERGTIPRVSSFADIAKFCDVGLDRVVVLATAVRA